MVNSQGLAKRLQGGAIICSLLLAMFAGHCWGDSSISLVVSGKNPAYQKVASSIAENLSSTDQAIHYVTHAIDPESPSESNNISKSDLVITVGAKATYLTLKQFPEQRVAACFITLSTLEKLTAEFPNRLLGAVVLDQPATRLLHLAQLVKPDMSRLGLLTGRQSQKRIPELTKASKDIGISLNKLELQPTQNPVKALESIFANSEGYLVLPDKADFNRQTAKWIIYLGYRHRIPVIGYSSRYVDAGALLSIYSTPEHIGRQSYELIEALIKGESGIHKFQYPKYFVIRLNDKVKRSLGFPDLDANTLARKLMAKETEPYHLEKQDANHKTE